MDFKVTGFKAGSLEYNVKSLQLMDKNVLIQLKKKM